MSKKTILVAMPGLNPPSRLAKKQQSKGCQADLRQGFQDSETPTQLRNSLDSTLKTPLKGTAAKFGRPTLSALISTVNTPENYPQSASHQQLSELVSSHGDTAHRLGSLFEHTLKELSKTGTYSHRLLSMKHVLEAAKAETDLSN